MYCHAPAASSNAVPSFKTGLLVAATCALVGFGVSAAHQQLNAQPGLALSSSLAGQTMTSSASRLHSTVTHSNGLHAISTPLGKPRDIDPLDPASTEASIRSSKVNMILLPAIACGLLVAAVKLLQHDICRSVPSPVMSTVTTRPTDYQCDIAIMAVAGRKVAILGASGGVGQPMALLLTDFDPISNLALYGVGKRVTGVSVDLSHCNTATKVAGHRGETELANCLKGSDIVIITAGQPREPGMTRGDLFKTNAPIVQPLVEACIKYCPKAILLVITDPVNSLVPMTAEILKKAGVYDPRKLIGVTSLDICRANSFVAEALGREPEKENVVVIGGHARSSILPLLSQVPGANFSPEEVKALTYRIQYGGDEVVKAKNGGGSATLSMAYSGTNFVRRLIRAMNGEKGIVECCYTNNKLTEVPFFATPTLLGPNGAEQVLPFGKLSASEQQTLNEMMPSLHRQINRGIDYIKAQK